MYCKATVASIVSFLLMTPAAIAETREPAGPAALRAAIQAGDSAGLSMARAALLGPSESLFRAAVGELARDTRTEARAIMRDATANTDPMESRHSAILRAWAASYVLATGEHAAKAALSGLNDSTAEPMDRGLHLLAYHTAAPTDRSVYRRCLQDDDAFVRRASIQVNGILWDFDALPELLELEDDSDPVVRRAARALVRRYFIWGPTRPTPLDRKMANSAFEPFDRQGLRSWRMRGPAWEQRQAESVHALQKTARD